MPRGSLPTPLMPKTLTKVQNKAGKISDFHLISHHISQIRCGYHGMCIGLEVVCAVSNGDIVGDFVLS